MQIVIDEEQIRQIVEEETKKAVRKRIREMQGDYTSKGYLENLMQSIIWDTIVNKIPNIEDYVKERIDEVVRYKKKTLEVPSKTEVIEYIVDNLKDWEE